MPVDRPDTVAIATAIVGYLQAAVFPNTSNKVYVQTNPETGTPGGVQLGQFKDTAGYLPPNSTNAIAEVYANLDDSARHALGGKVWDTPTFYVLSIVDMTNANQAELQIMLVRDAIVPAFVKHVQLGGAGTVFLAKYKTGSGRYLKVFRDATEYRAHVFELETKVEWNIVAGFAV